MKTASRTGKPWGNRMKLRFAGGGRRETPICPMPALTLRRCNPIASSSELYRVCPECRSVKDDSLENRLAARNTEGTEEGGTEGFWRWSLPEGATLRKHIPNTFPEAKTEKEKMPSERSPLPATSVSPSSARSVFASQAEEKGERAGLSMGGRSLSDQHSGLSP